LRSRSFIAVAVLLALLTAAAVAVILYDDSKNDTIAEGVKVGGVDIGGMTRTEATARLRREILEPLRRPVTIDHGARTWRLTAREAQIATNIDATVDDALARSRRGNIFERTWREATGGRINASIEPTVTYDDGAIVRMLDRVRKRVNRPAKDATMKFDATGPQLTPGVEGLAVDASSLHRKIRAALVSPTAKRRFAAVTHHVEPKVTSKDLEAQYDTALVVNRNAFQLVLYKHLKKVKAYDIAVGAVGLETPAGLYHIQNKAVNPAWTKPNSDWVPADERGDVIPGGTPENPLKARWLGIFAGAGIHGIDPSEYGSIGHAASHGCVRMRIPDVIDLYPRVPVGAPIYIA
jgi:lipoprotein-anchoring transpeptidase ErfK/SrfK